MNKKRLALLTVTLVLTAGLLTGCGSFGQYFGGKWAAKVNSEKISLDEFNKQLDRAKKSYEGQGMDFKSEQGKPMLDALRSQILDDMISGKVILQEASKQGIVIDNAQVESDIKSIKEQYFAKADGTIDDAKYQEALKANGLTEEDLKTNRKESMTAEALFKKTTADIQVSDADILQYYNDNKDSFSDPEQVKAKHILVATEEEAKAIIAQLKAGADFATLAKQKSTDTGSKDSGGDLGYFGKGEMVAEFDTAAFALANNKYTEIPVKTTYGYHVILVEDHKLKVQKTFDQVKEDIKQTLPQKKQEEKFKQFLQDLRKQAKIEYAPDFKPAATPSAPIK